MAWLDDIERVLIDAGVVASGAVFFSSRSKVPAGAGPYVTISATSGGPPRDIQAQAVAYQYPSAQILVRAASHVAARDKAMAALLALGVVRNRVINSTHYLSITALQSEPHDMGLDDTSERIIMAFNVLGDRRRS